MAGIEASRLTHVYDNGHTGLDDVGFTAKDGEFLALIGPSGSGKTTLLRTIAGFLRPSSGSLSIGGRTVVDGDTWVPPEGRGLGMVFQDHAIWPHWSVHRNVAYPLKLAKVPREETDRRVEAVLAKVGLEGAGDRDPSALSGGQRQRVALARAIVASPQALLLDEALSSLDEPLRARLRLELKALTREEGLTAIHVTHDRSEALALADRIVVLRDGRVEQIGTPQELRDSPATAFVASFVFDATLFDARSAEGRLRLGDGPSLDVRQPQWAGERMATGTAAVLPSDVVLRPAGPDGGATGVITSALYGPHGFDVSVDWQGTTLRAHVADRVPVVGEAVVPEILSAHWFPVAAAH